MNFMNSIFKLLLIFLLVILIVLTNSYTNIDGFQNNITNKWSSDLIKRFNIYQTTMNDNANQFNLDLLQQQVTPEEAEEYLKTGYWKWSDELKNLYIEKVWASPIIKIDPQYALDYAMRLYNERAVTELLAWNTKEGHFLLYGADLGVSTGMPKDLHNTLKCNADGKMEKKIYTGMNTWNGYMNSNTTIIKPEDIPKEMPGFSFVKTPCNPCAVFNEKRDFSCPFRINIEGDDTISEPWKRLFRQGTS